MSVRALTRAEFDAFQPRRLPVAEELVEEREWYADPDETVIGLLARHGAAPNWYLAIFGRDDRGQFRAFDADTGIRLLDTARRRLFQKMEQALAEGEMAFPYDD